MTRVLPDDRLSFAQQQKLSITSADSSRETATRIIRRFKMNLLTVVYIFAEVSAFLIRSVVSGSSSIDLKVVAGCQSSLQVLDTLYVRSRLECAVRCKAHPHCVSANAVKEEKGGVRCELLDSVEDEASLDCGEPSHYMCEYRSIV